MSFLKSLHRKFRGIRLRPSFQRTLRDICLIRRDGYNLIAVLRVLSRHVVFGNFSLEMLMHKRSYVSGNCVIGQ